jgi:hypothetical protein
MRQEMADFNPWFISIRKPRSECGEPARHRIVEPDHASIDECHRRGGDNRLRE